MPVVGALAFSTEAISSLSCWTMIWVCRSLRLVNCGNCCGQRLLHADEVGDDQVPVVSRPDAANLTNCCVVE